MPILDEECKRTFPIPHRVHVAAISRKDYMVHRHVFVKIKVASSAGRRSLVGWSVGTQNRPVEPDQAREIASARS